MLIVEINEKEYNLPENWSEVTVEKFEKIMRHSSFLSEYKSQTLFALEMFGLLLDCPVEEIKKLSKDSFSVLSEKCAWANEEIKSSLRNEFHINDKVYIAVKDFNKLSMGDAVSLEIMIGESKNEEILGNILPMLIRKAKPVVKNGESVLEAGEFNADEYNELRDLFKKNIMVTDVIGLKDFF
jgi:hypothetical protein